MTATHWDIYGYPEIPSDQLEIRSVRSAVASRAESGGVYWESPNPRRSFVRGAVYDNRRRLVDISQRMGGMNSDMVLSVNPPILLPREHAEAKQREFSGRWLYAGSWMHGFGHFLVETLPTFWPLIDRAVDFDGICAHRFNSLKTFDWQFELVALLSDKPVHVIDDAPEQYEELTVATRPYHYQVAIAPIAARVWDHVSETVGADGDDLVKSPVYLSRTKFQQHQLAQSVSTGREIHNSEDVDETFASHGFRVIYPEELSVTEQIRLVRSAPILAGASGSALHLSVFARPGTRVIEVGDSRTRASLVATQKAISAVKNQLTAQIPYSEVAPGIMDSQALASALWQLGVPSPEAPQT